MYANKNKPNTSNFMLKKKIWNKPRIQLLKE